MDLGRFRENLAELSLGRNQARLDLAVVYPLAPHPRHPRAVFQKCPLGTHRSFLSRERENREGVSIDRQCRPVVDTDAALARVSKKHRIEVVCPQHPVALHLIVVRAEEAWQEAESIHPDVLPTLLRSFIHRSSTALVPRSILARSRDHGILVRVGIHAVRMPPIEPANGASAPASHNGAARHRRPQCRDQPQPNAPVDGEEGVPAREDDSIRRIDCRD
mmetsp:Transcript_66830/g.159459  ORF Transcript_66830/g.159459 Transcript_66830/m.159459 type:complete len:219 (-) Transcript_66830:340-996(-)